MKTMQIIISLVPAYKAQFILDTKGHTLTQVKFIKSIIHLNGDVTHVFSHNGKVFEIPQSNTEYQFFESAYNFERGINIVPINFKTNKSMVKTEKFKLYISDDDNAATLLSVTMLNGVPVVVDAPVKWFEFDGRWMKPIAEESADLSKYYDSVEAALCFNSYRVQKDDGTEAVNEGKYSYLLLDEKQQKAVDKARKAIQEAEALGVTFIQDRCDDKVYAINGNKAACDWDGNEGYCFQHVNLPESHHMPAILSFTSDDSYFSIVRKNNPEE